jgi:hypothetical protein
MDVKGVFLSTTSSIEVQGVFPPPPAVWTDVDVQGVFPAPPAVWMCWVSRPHQQYGRAGCLSTTSSMDVQGVRFSTFFIQFL